MKRILSFLILLFLQLVYAESLIPRARYVAEFEAKATTKIYPQDWQLLGINAQYPSVSLVFRNSSKKIVRPWRCSNILWINSPDFMPYKFEFYLPEKISNVKLYPIKAKIRNFKLRKIDSSKVWSIPLNPLAIGTWRGSYVTIHDDKAIFEAEKNWIYSDPMPVATGESYRVIIEGEPSAEKDGLIRLQFYSDVLGPKSFVAKNKEPIRIRKRQKIEYEFVVPQKAKWLRVGMTWGTYYSFKVEKIK